jgi:predicted Zn-dependent peptidase
MTAADNVITWDGGATGLSAAGIWIDAGAADEDADEAGTCHFIEHAVFRGAGGHPGGALQEALGRVAGEVNAFTTQDATCLYAATLTEDLPAAIALLTEAAFAPELADEQLERERPIVLAEIASAADRPGQAVRDLAVRAAWGDARQAGPITGTVGQVRGLPGDRIRRFHRSHFLPSRAVLAVAGDLSSLAGRAASCPPRTIAGARARTPALAFAEGAVAQVAPTRQTHLCVAIRAPGAGSADERWLDLASAVLGRGPTSFLHAALRGTKSMAYQVNATPVRTRAGSVLLIYAAVHHEAVEPALAEIGLALARLSDGDIGVARFDALRRDQIFAIRQAAADPMRQMMRLGRKALRLGRSAAAPDAEQDLHALTVDDVRAGLGAVFAGAGRRCTAVIGPAPPPDFAVTPELAGR